MAELKSWREVAPKLVDVAAGRAMPTLSCGAGVGERPLRRDRAGDGHRRLRGRFAYCGPDAKHTIGPGTKVVDAGGATSFPACATATCMSKAALLTVTEFAARWFPHGTTSMFADPHEIANVLGLEASG